MFEKTPLTATSPENASATGPLVVWHPDTFDWVRLEPADLLGDDIEPGFLERSARALPVDAERTPTGPELAAVLSAFDAGAADAHNLVEAAAGWARLAAWVAAKEADVLSELASRPEQRPAETSCRSVNPVTTTAVELAGRCQVTARQAENQVGHALQLTEDFPDTHTTLASGLIDVRRARVITDELGGQDPDVRARVEAAVLPKAPELDAVALRKLIRRLLHELAPVEQAERHRAARDRRYVAVMPASDGMAHLEALLPAEDATALNTALNVAAADAKRADAAAGVPARTKDQRRADALAALGWAALAACAEAATVPVDSPHGGAADGPGGVRAGGAAGCACDDPATGADDGRAGGAAGRACDDSAAAATGGGRAGDGAGGPGSFHAGGAAGRACDDPAGADGGRAGGAAGRTPGNPATGIGGSTAGRTPGDPATGAGDGRAGGAAASTAAVGAALATGAVPATGAAGDPSAVGAVVAGGGSPVAGRSARRPISVHVTVPFTTLAGLSDEPGELEGYGPIPAHVARVLAAEGVWTWLRTDPATGQLLDLGGTRYRPSRALAEFITARDRTCRMPGCHRAARTADLDHIVPFAAGGPTSRANLQALCETHHLIKHHGRWSAERHPEGTTRWTSPTGHRYLKPPG